MKLEGKKELAARTLNVGKNRIVFNVNRLNEIKEAITKQDIKDLYATGAILIKKIKGRRKLKKRKTRKRAGSIKNKPKKGKKEYVVLTRKLRAHLKNLKFRGKISQEKYEELRKGIRNRAFRSLSHIKENITEAA